MKQLKRNKCEYDGCHRVTQYWIGHRSEDKALSFIPVCGTHDKSIGRQNLMGLGWTLDEAIKFERASK